MTGRQELTDLEVNWRHGGGRAVCRYIGGLLFRNVNIPAGATVTVPISISFPPTYDDPNLTIRGELTRPILRRLATT
jgi:hypothetical protein